MIGFLKKHVSEAENDKSAGSLRTNKTHKRVAPRRFGDPKHRFLPPGSWRRKLAFALSTAGVVLVSQIGNASAQSPGAARNRELNTSLGFDTSVNTWTLPMDRWLNNLQMRSDFGFFDGIIGPIMNVITGFFFVIASFVWWIIRAVLTGAFTADFFNEAAYDINNITQIIGNFITSSGLIWIILIAVIAMVFMQVMKGATTSIFKTALSTFLPMAFLFFTVAAATASVENPPTKIGGGVDKEAASARSLPGSPGWIVNTGLDLTNLIAESLAFDFAGANTAELLYEDPKYPMPDEKNPNSGFGTCALYVENIYKEYEEKNRGNLSAPILSSVSQMWERTVLVNWIEAQFGTRNDIGRRVFCHALEEGKAVAPPVRWHLLTLTFVGVENRVPGGRPSQDQYTEGDWGRTRDGSKFYSDASVAGVRNECKSDRGRGAASSLVPPLGKTDAAGNQLEDLSLVRGSSVSNQSPAACLDEANQDQDTNQNRRPPPTTGPKYPEKIFQTFRPEGKKFQEANLVAYGWCTWDIGAASADPNNAFNTVPIDDTGDKRNEFSHVWQRDDDNGARFHGLNERQFCNQWWDFGEFDASGQNTDGAFIFDTGDRIRGETSRNGVQSIAAENFLFSMNGHGGAPAAVLGFLSMIVSIFYAVALLGLALYVLLAQIQLFIAMALLPVFLVAGTIPHPKGKNLMKGGFKMILSGLFAKTLATAIFVALLFVITILTNILVFAIGGTFSSIWAAIAPLVALFALRRIPGVKELTTVRGALKGSRQRIAKTLTGGQNLGPPQRGFINRQARQMARTTGRSFAYGLTGFSPSSGREMGMKLRNRATDAVDRKRSGRAAKKEANRLSKLPPPPEDKKEKMDPFVNTKDFVDNPSKTKEVELAGKPFIVGANTVLNTDKKNGDDPTGKTKEDKSKNKGRRGRTVSSDDVAARTQKNAEAAEVGQAAVSGRGRFRDTVSGFFGFRRKSGEAVDPEIVVSDAPSVGDARTSDAVYSDLAGGAAHQDSSGNAPRPTVIYTTFDEGLVGSYSPDYLAGLDSRLVQGGAVVFGGNAQGQGNSTGGGGGFAQVLNEMNNATQQDVARSNANAAARAARQGNEKVQRSIAEVSRRLDEKKP